MTDLTYYDLNPGSGVELDASAPVAQVVSIHRSPLITILMFIPVVFCAISWLADGIPALTDLAFIALSVLCVVGMLLEVRSFPARFGVGAMVVYGGTLIWFCHDYFNHWFNIKFTLDQALYARAVIAKAGFFTCLFVWFAAIGLFLPPSRRVLRLADFIPEPPAGSVYIAVIFITFALGLIPYLFFTVEPFYLAIFKSMMGMRTGEGAIFTVGRTGNYNYSWGAYLAQLIQVGGVGGLLAGFYFIMVPGSIPGKIFAGFVWLFWALIAFGTGSRGELLYAVLPVISLIFIKYVMMGNAYVGRISIRAVLYSGIALFITLIAVKIQGAFRESGLESADLQSVDYLASDGNAMFSAGLLGYQCFPDPFPHPANTFPGASFIRPIPDAALRFAIGWIPRVLWHNKPGISETGQWYNRMLSGGTAANDQDSEQTHGGTVAPSIAGTAYIYYGLPGVIEMGLLFGWLCGVCEHFMRATISRPFGLMFSLGCSAYMFRAYRDLTPHNLYPLLIGTIVISSLIYFLRLFSAQPAPQYAFEAY